MNPITEQYEQDNNLVTWFYVTMLIIGILLITVFGIIVAVMI